MFVCFDAHDPHSFTAGVKVDEGLESGEEMEESSEDDGSGKEDADFDGFTANELVVGNGLAAALALVRRQVWGGCVSDFFVVTHTSVFLFSPALGTDRPHIGDTKTLAQRSLHTVDSAVGALSGGAHT